MVHLLRLPQGLPLITVVLLLMTSPVGAGAVGEEGDEFQVNTQTTGAQDYAAVGPDGAGGFVVVWRSNGSSGTDSDGTSIQGQRYDSGGSPASGEFQVNSYTTGAQGYPAVGSDGAAGFVVTWTSRGSSGTDSDDASIQAQRFASDGSPTGSEFQVNTETTDDQEYSVVGPDGAGGFVVVWMSDYSSGTDVDLRSIQAQRYAPDGTPEGGQFQVNTYTTRQQREPAVSPDGAGGFVVIWGSYGSSGSDTSVSSIQAQRYASDGSPAGGQFQVNTYSWSLQFAGAVGPDGAGGFVVTWGSVGSNGTDQDSHSIQAQRFASDGSPAGSEFQVNTDTTGYQAYSAVAPDGAGGFVVSWESEYSNGTGSDGHSIQAQRFASDGSLVGDQFQVNTYTTGYQTTSAIGPDAGAGFVVIWDSWGSSGTDQDSYSVQAQRYAWPEIFADGFESGDTSAWSETVP